jgi:hypothetical protein
MNLLLITYECQMKKEIYGQTAAGWNNQALMLLRAGCRRQSFIRRFRMKLTR